MAVFELVYLPKVFELFVQTPHIFLSRFHGGPPGIAPSDDVILTHGGLRAKFQRLRTLVCRDDYMALRQNALPWGSYEGGVSRSVPRSPHSPINRFFDYQIRILQNRFTVTPQTVASRSGF